MLMPVRAMLVPTITAKKTSKTMTRNRVMILTYAQEIVEEDSTFIQNVIYAKRNGANVVCTKKNIFIMKNAKSAKRYIVLDAVGTIVVRAKATTVNSVQYSQVATDANRKHV
jgi:hypothetical protein